MVDVAKANHDKLMGVVDPERRPRIEAEMGRIVETELITLQTELKSAIDRKSVEAVTAAGAKLLKVLNSPEFKAHQAEMTQLVGEITRQFDGLDPETKRLITRTRT
jgi:hypothetical protein